MDGLDTGLLVLRLLVGLTLAAHGAQKLFGAFGGGGLHGTGAWLESIGFRPGRRQAQLAGGTELAGGLLFGVGLLTPVAAAMVIGVMIVAGVAGHAGKGFFITRGGWEYCLLLAGVASGLAFTGPGAWSLDHAMGFVGGGLLWGLFAIALGIAVGTGQLATRRTAVARRDPAPPPPAPAPATARPPISARSAGSTPSDRA